ncbi:MAG: glycosyl hydrolase [Kiritimatiellia bacterium]
MLPCAEVIPYPTLLKAKQFFDAGGVVVAYGMLPSKSATLGRGAQDIADLCGAIWGAAAPGLGRCKTNAAGGRSYFLPEAPTSDEVRRLLADDAGVHPTLEVAKGDTGNGLHVLHRQKTGRDVFLVCNQHHEGAARAFTFRIRAKGEPECWDAMRGGVEAVPHRRVDADVVEVDLTLEPSESVLLVFNEEKRPLPMRIDAHTKPAHALIEVRPTRPPVEKAKRERLVVVSASYGVPGDAARTRDVRGKLQKIIDGGAQRLAVADLAKGDDPAYGVVKTLVAECTAGDRRVTLQGQDPQTLSLGESSPARMELERLAAGRPYAASPVEADPFEGMVELPATVDPASARVCLELDGVAPEEAARVTINGRDAGGMIGRPLRLDVTALLQPGANAVKIEPFAPASVRLAVYGRE